MFILIITFIVTVLWIASSIINTKPSEEVSADLQTALEPLNPNFDQKTLDRINNIQAPTQVTTSSPTPIPTPVTIPLPSIAPSFTPTPQINNVATNSASSSATIQQ